MASERPVADWPGELDVHLFGEGRHRRLWQLLGAHRLEPAGGAERGTRFAVWAPNAAQVWVVGDWNQWGDGTAMHPVAGSGMWCASVAAARPGHTYKYAVVDSAGRTVLKA
ncbi:MAG TPA: hypothetical protein PLV68_08040, partial [Ilumatobacteraceae bacterium]|nr:hypothetical protein [Ilumatobacteraceae bacterium]